MAEILTLEQVAREATDTLCTFRPGKPDLIHTGIGPVDRAVGGLLPGQGGVLALMQGVGKTSTIFTAAATGDQPVGVINVEDTVDLMGTKALALETGINSLRIRRKDLSADEVARLKKALASLNASKSLFVCHPGASIEQVCEYAERMVARGVRMLYLDYVQKIRGIREDRNNEVATAYTTFQRACFDAGAACIVASQFSRKTVRVGDTNFYREAQPTDRPNLTWLKESGDLENEGRLIILGWRDRSDKNLLHYSLDKSTFGDEGLEWSMRRDAAGILREVDPYRSEEW